MRNTIIFIASLLFCPALLNAQASRPLPPASETPFTPSSDPYLADIVSIATPPISLEGARLSFDITIQNPNDREIRCINTKFLSYLGIFGDRCEFSDYTRYIDINSGKGALDIPARGEYSVAHIGNKEREDRSRTLGKDLEFCRRDAWDLDCGYTCSNGKKYNDSWDEPITGGSKKFRCEANGEVKRTLDQVSCESGYSADPINDRCLKLCDATHRAGDTWETTIDFGKATAQCLTSGQISTTISCDQSRGYVSNGSSCVPVGCSGGAAHGDRVKQGDIANGSVTAMCSFGNWIDPQASCNSGYSASGVSCVENGCDGAGPGTTKSEHKACGPGYFGSGLTTEYQCRAGQWIYVRTSGRCKVDPR